MREFKYIVLDEPQDKFLTTFIGQKKFWKAVSASALNMLPSYFIFGRKMLPRAQGRTITFNRNAN